MKLLQLRLQAAPTATSFCFLRISLSRTDPCRPARAANPRHVPYLASSPFNCWCPTSLVLDDQVAVIVMDDHDIIVEHTIVDGAHGPNLVEIDECSWCEIAEGQIVDIGWLDLVIDIRFWHESGGWADVAGPSLGTPETDHVFF